MLRPGPGWMSIRTLVHSVTGAAPSRALFPSSFAQSVTLYELFSFFLLLTLDRDPSFCVHQKQVTTSQMFGTENGDKGAWKLSSIQINSINNIYFILFLIYGHTHEESFIKMQMNMKNIYLKSQIIFYHVCNQRACSINYICIQLIILSTIFMTIFQ